LFLSLLFLLPHAFRNTHTCLRKHIIVITTTHDAQHVQDTWAYRAVSIHLSRIFTVNHKGELKLELIQTFQSS
jgi:hypothetical protein